LSDSKPLGLICTLGLSPEVVARSLDRLLFGEEAASLREVVLIHTKLADDEKGKETRARLAELWNAFRGSAFRPDDDEQTDEGVVYACQIAGAPERKSAPFRLSRRRLAFPDLDRTEYNELMMARLCREVGRLRRGGLGVVMNIAGGRKSQSAYGMLAASLFGAARVLHIMPAEGFEDPKTHLKVMHPPFDWYRIVELPFPDLSGAFEALQQDELPADDADLARLIRRRLPVVSAAAAVGAGELAALEGDHGIRRFGDVRYRSEAMAACVNRLRHVAKLPFPILLLGPSGSGKSRLARQIHAESGLPGKLQECGAGDISDRDMAELCGTAAGQYTGVLQTEGHFHKAHGGTLFIDDIDNLNPEFQAKLLTPFNDLPEVKFFRRGSSALETKRIRMIFATNKNPQELVKSGVLKADFLRRIALATIAVPSLKDRTEDIPLLVEDLLRDISGRMNCEVPRLKERELRELERFDWRGVEVDHLQSALKSWIGEPDRTLDALRRLAEERRAPAQPLGPDEDERSSKLAREVIAGHQKFADLEKTLRKPVARKMVDYFKGHKGEFTEKNRNDFLRKWTGHGEDWLDDKR
jgi:DNA-binding NtrC family response regulator